MSVDVEFVRRHGLYFRDELGRLSHALASGEDTTFIENMKHRGAREVFLNESRVIHAFDARRLGVAYIMRRAMWQGRSEFRRGQAMRGPAKEWKRNVLTERQSAIQIGFGVICFAAVITGVWIEAVSKLLQCSKKSELFPVEKY